MTRKLLFIVTSFALLFPVFAQAQLRVSAKVDKTTILVGEEIKINLIASVPSNIFFRGFVIDSIPHFSILNKGNRDSSYAGSEKVYQQEIIITSYDSGTWTIPGFYALKGKKGPRTDSFSINVTYSTKDPIREYHDIRDIIEVKNRNSYLYWVIGLITIILTGIVLYFIYKKKKGKPGKKVLQPFLSPFDEAKEELNKLRPLLPDDSLIKQNFTKLNRILKLYVEKKYGFTSSDKTNEELILQLKNKNWKKSRFAEVAQALRMCDFVKFAKYRPGIEEREQAFNSIRQAIVELESLDKGSENAV